MPRFPYWKLPDQILFGVLSSPMRATDYLILLILNLIIWQAMYV